MLTPQIDLSESSVITTAIVAVLSGISRRKVYRRAELDTVWDRLCVYMCLGATETITKLPIFRAVLNPNPHRKFNRGKDTSILDHYLS
jgi:hypothetical protein